MAHSLPAWTQTCDPVGAGIQAGLILSAIIWPEETPQNRLILQPVAQLPVVTGRSEHQSGVSSACSFICDSSSALRQSPRMHLSSWRSAAATLSCSLTGCWHCRRRLEIWNTWARFTYMSRHESRHTYTPVQEPRVCLPSVSDRGTLLPGCSTTLSPHTLPGQATLPSSGD